MFGRWPFHRRSGSDAPASISITHKIPGYWEIIASRATRGPPFSLSLCRWLNTTRVRTRIPSDAGLKTVRDTSNPHEFGLVENRTRRRRVIIIIVRRRYVTVKFQRTIVLKRKQEVKIKEEENASGILRVSAVDRAGTRLSTRASVKMDIKSRYIDASACRLTNKRIARQSLLPLPRHCPLRRWAASARFYVRRHTVSAVSTGWPKWVTDYRNLAWSAQPC